MKRPIFDDIHSLKDIQKQKARLEEKLKATEKSFSDKTDITRLIFRARKGMNRFSGKKDFKLEIIESLLPLGIELIVGLMRKKLDKRLAKRLIIYSIYGSVFAFVIYKYLNSQEEKVESD